MKEIRDLMLIVSSVSVSHFPFSARLFCSSRYSQFRTRERTLLMVNATDIGNLFVKLASTIRHHSSASTPNDTGNEEMDVAISSLAASLNPETTSSSRTRVLDAALSLMCFKAPEVWRSNVKWLVYTIDAVLSSSVSCKVVRFGECDGKGNEFLMIGSSVFVPDFENLIDVLDSLEGSGFFYPLLQTLLKVAISTPRYQSSFPISSVFIERNRLSYDGRKKLALKFQCLSTEENSINYNEIQLRLFSWYIDPRILKDDILEILADAIHRPYLHLKDEFHSNITWRFFIICLVSSPSTFMETRLLLHNWFLLNGLSSMLELQIAVVSSALDMLARPMAWGLPFKMGLNLPFPRAYFHRKHHDLLTILRGPISNQNFLELVHLIRLFNDSSVNQLKLSVSHNTNINGNMKEKSTSIDSNSTWAMLICFPCWFYFATVLLFRTKDTGRLFLPFGPEKDQVDARNKSKLYQAAASFVALILDPFDHTSQAFLVDCINKITRAWPDHAKANYSSDPARPSQSHVKSSSPHSKKKRFRVVVKGKLQNTKHESKDSTIKLWLQQFHQCFVFQNCDLAASIVKSKDSIQTFGNLVVTKIILGIMLSDPHYLNEEACRLLLHYAATGEILEEEVQFDITESMSSGLCIDSGVSPDVSSTINWSMGASLTLHLLDIVEEMTCTFFETEDARIDYISQIKSKTVGYLVWCTRKILKSKQGVGVEVVQTDLLKRLLLWKQWGSVVVEGYKNIDDVIQEIHRNFRVTDQPI